MAGTADHFVDDSAFLAAAGSAGNPDTQLVLYQDAPHGAHHLPSITLDWVARRNEFLNRPTGSRTRMSAAPAGCVS